MEFVYDRSAQDVLQMTKKGVLNAEDINRIENNTGDIADKIAVPVTVKSWSVGGLPRVSDYKRIRDNVERIRQGYGIRSDTPATPEQPLNTYQKWNDIERILFDVNDLYDRTENARAYCGEIFAGEGVGIL